MAKTQSRTIHDGAIRLRRSGRESAYLGETSPERRARAETMLARYPALAGDELAELLRWYRREASAMDVALLASNDAIREAYRAFRRDHVERFTLKERAVTALLAAGVLGLFAFGLLGDA
jgi:hypothetical protein